MENNLNPNKKYAKSSLEELEGASHGLTKGQLQAVYEAQKQGQEFTKIPANKDNDYMINEHEKFVYHVKITIPRFDEITGEDLSKSRIDMFPPAMFEQCKGSGTWKGRHVVVLHDPTREQFKDENGKFMKKPIAKIL